MKIKTLLVCFLAVCAVSLSSCKKDKDYTADFVGNYDLTITPSITMEVMGSEEALDGEAMEGMTCAIAKTVDNNVSMTIVYTDEETGVPAPVVVLNGKCDETGLNLESKTIVQSLELGGLTDLGFENMDINVTIGSASISAPVNGVISWTSGINGTIGVEIPTEIGTMPLDIALNGSLSCVGTKK